MGTKMIVTAWKGGTYGIRIDKKDRKHFSGKTSIRLKLQGDDKVFSVNVSKSFWKNCPELRSANIGKWLKRNRRLPWGKGHPPKLELKQQGRSNYFDLRLLKGRD